MFSSGYFHFTQAAEDRWTCCRTYPEPLNPDGCELPVIFHMLAYISPHDCFLTRRGDYPYFGREADNGCMASCWLDPCNNPQSRNNWRCIQRNILTLREHSGVPLQLPFMFRNSPLEYLLSMQVGADYEEGQEVWTICFSTIYRISQYAIRQTTNFPFLTVMAIVSSPPRFPMSLSVNLSKYFLHSITQSWGIHTIFMHILFVLISVTKLFLFLQLYPGV